ncbi:MAG TPA: PIN domain-containing protein [Chloroflexota bacterium]|nr:PIN domain-containing protein [Chloroflexota bacterium]
MTSLADTDVLVYRFDDRIPEKQQIATEVLRAGIGAGTLYVAHQAIVEFVAAVTRPQKNTPPILEVADAMREAEELLMQFEVLYPDAELVRLALRGAAAYQLSCFDAHMWAYAERFGMDEIVSEDFQHGRMYGDVRVVNPFVAT